MYSGVECVCGVTLSVYLHRASYTRRGQADFSACPVWIYTQSKTTNTLQGTDYMLLSTFAEDAESISGPNISINVKSMMSIYICMF